MVITAKFNSICPCCSKPIDVGSQVEWSKGAKATHVACKGRPATSTPRSSGRGYVRRSRGARYCEGWGADNPHAPCPPYTCTQCRDE